MSSLERLAISNDDVNSYFYPLLTASIDGRLGCLEVPASEELGPYEEFGTWLREMRVAAKFASQPQAEIRARTRGLRLINQGKLSHIERGMNGNPDPKFLAQLAELYGLKYSDVVARWMNVRYRVVTDADSGLSRHGRTGQQTPRLHGESDAPATDNDSADREIRELRGQIEEYRALLGQVENAASTLATVIAAGEQIGEARRTQPKARRRHRTAG